MTSNINLPEIRVEFYKTNSSNYDGTIAIFEKFHNFNSAGKLNTFIIDFNELPFEINIIESYIDIISKWKNTRFYINNKLTNKSYLKRMFQIYQCYEGHKHSVNRETYCFIDSLRGKEGWGCKFITNIKRHLPEALNEMNYYNFTRFWFEYGELIDGVWVVHKDRILQTLLDEVTKTGIVYCPLFKQDKLIQFVNILPETINPKTDKEWEYVEKTTDDGFQTVSRIVGVRPKELGYSNGIIDTRKFKIDILKEIREGKTNNRYVPDTSFDDIGGLGKILDDIRFFVELPMKEPELIKYMNLTPHKGILLSGPPGCGKTLIAKAIAREINAHFIAVNGPELLSKWYGQSEENLRDIFEEASAYAPSIIFFDEFDAIAKSRSGDDVARIDSQIVNQLLTLLDGFNSDERVMVIAATNRPELLDKAVTRSGRFDYHLEIKEPTLEGCKEILKIHIRDKPTDTDFNIDEFSKRLMGLSGSDIAFIVKEAAYNCIKRNIDVKEILNEKEIDYKHLLIKDIDFNMALEKIRAKNSP